MYYIFQKGYVHQTWAIDTTVQVSPWQRAHLPKCWWCYCHMVRWLWEMFISPLLEGLWSPNLDKRHTSYSIQFFIDIKPVAFLFERVFIGEERHKRPLKFLSFSKFFLKYANLFDPVTWQTDNTKCFTDVRRFQNIIIIFSN